MFCSQCGARLTGGGRFCGDCGVAVGGAVPAQSTPGAIARRPGPPSFEKWPGDANQTLEARVKKLASAGEEMIRGVKQRMQAEQPQLSAAGRQVLDGLTQGLAALGRIAKPSPSLKSELPLSLPKTAHSNSDSPPNLGSPPDGSR